MNIAYHDNQSEKDTILAQLQLHYDADEIVKGKYWEDGKGCAVGCTIHSGDHAQYEPLFGIPQSLAYLEDRIFEGLQNELSKEWPLRFMRSIRPGADLSLVQWKFLHWLITDVSVNPGINHSIVKDAISKVAKMIYALANGNSVDESAVWSAESAASSAAWSAESAAWSAWSAARSAAESAAWSACSACSAWSACSAARSAAESAAWSAESAAWSACSAESAYEKMADKLIEILEQA